VVALAILSVLSAFILMHYFGKDVISSLTYASDPDWWCTPAVARTEGIGVHCFGDYASVVGSAAEQNPWAPAHGTASNYPAAGMLPQALFGAIGNLFGSAGLGTIAYLAVVTGALLVPSIWATRGKPTGIRLVTVALFGVLSIPSLMTLDRGNNVALAVPALLAYLVALRKKRYSTVVVAVIAASLIKPQFVLLIVILLMLRKWKYALAAVLGVGITNLLAYLIWPKDFPATVWQTALAITHYGGGVPLTYQYPSNVSLPKGLYWIEVLIRQVTGASNNSWTAAHAGVVSVGILALVIVPLLLVGKRMPSHIAGVVLLACASLFTSTSWSYYLVFALAVGAVILRDPLERAGDPHTWQGAFDQLSLTLPQRVAVFFIVAAVAVTVMQVALPIGSTVPGQATVDFAQASLLHTSVDLAPVLWLLAIFGSIVAWALPDRLVNSTRISAMSSSN
jgi:hypothetical protein